MKNILLITGDHVRHDAVACNGGPLAQVIQTPHLDRLAREGVSFANSFTPNPICVPARAAITTGRYPHKCTGIKNNSGLIKDGQAKIAEHFAQHGYATCAIGKLHYEPYAPPGEPRLLHGFQYAELCEEGRIINKFEPDGQLAGLEDYHDFLKRVGWGGYERAHGIGNNDVHPAPSPLPAEYYVDAWVADRTIARLATMRGKPFFVWASFIKPHPPYDPPRPWDTRYDPRTMPAPLAGDLAGRDAHLAASRDWYAWGKLSPEAVQLIRAHYCGLMSFQDEMVGRLVAFLEKTGMLDDTIIVYTADHGDLLGDFGRFFKSNMFDAAVKVPLIFRVPHGGAGRREQLVGLQDIFPTLCGLAGVPLPSNVDGLDLRPVLADPRASSRPFYVAQTLDTPFQKYMVRTERWKYVYGEAGGTEELYDVTRENAEQENLAAAQPSVTAELRQILIAWCREHGDFQMLTPGRDALRVSAPAALQDSAVRPGNFGWRKY